MCMHADDITIFRQTEEVVRAHLVKIRTPNKHSLLLALFNNVLQG